MSPASSPSIAPTRLVSAVISAESSSSSVSALPAPVPRFSHLGFFFLQQISNLYPFYSHVSFLPETLFFSTTLSANNNHLIGTRRCKSVFKSWVLLCKVVVKRKIKTDTCSSYKKVINHLYSLILSLFVVSLISFSRLSDIVLQRILEVTVAWFDVGNFHCFGGMICCCCGCFNVLIGWCCRYFNGWKVVLHRVLGSSTSSIGQSWLGEFEDSSAFSLPFMFVFLLLQSTLHEPFTSSDLPVEGLVCW